MNFRAFLNTVTTRAYTLPVVILYVTEGCNFKCITCSYREPLPGELTLAEIQDLAGALKGLGLRHIVYSGGEPLMRRDLPSICRTFAALGVKQSLLTNGVLLARRFEELQGQFHEIIVSLDGPEPGLHDAIRGVPSFSRIVEGIRHVHSAPDPPIVSIRSVVQRKNFRFLPAMVSLARSLGVRRISFLGADVFSGSFGHETGIPAPMRDEIALRKDEVCELRAIVERMVTEQEKEFAEGFISQTPDQLFRIVQYYEALAGTGEFPRNPCNAPMVSAVITSTGSVLPCFFLPPYGDVRRDHLPLRLNSPEIRATRRRVRAFREERCSTCVCTLNLQPASALLDRF